MFSDTRCSPPSSPLSLAFISVIILEPCSSSHTLGLQSIPRWPLALKTLQYGVCALPTERPEAMCRLPLERLTQLQCRQTTLVNE